MARPELQYVRIRNKILKADGSLHTECKSISKAKNLSRHLQGAAGGLGLGSLRVDRTQDPKAPPLDFGPRRSRWNKPVASRAELRRSNPQTLRIAPRFEKWMPKEVV